MHRLASVALTLLLATSLVTVGGAMPAGESNQQVQTDNATSLVALNDTANRLGLEAPVREGHTTAGPDLGASLAGADEAIRTDQDLYTVLGPAFLEAEIDEREERLSLAFDLVFEQIEDLAAEESAAVAGHANGELSADELLHRYQLLYVHAAYLEESLDVIEDSGNVVVNEPASGSEYRDVRTILEMHRTDIGDTINPGAEQLLLGDQQDLHVRSSPTGYSLSLVAGDTWHLETVRFDNRAAGDPDQFEGIIEAWDHALELYPWAGDQPMSQGIVERASVNLYEISMPHEQGSLDALLDGGSSDIHREYHELSLPAVPSEPAAGPVTEDGLTISVNQTAGNGPISVLVTDNETAEPVDAAIEVGGEPVGETAGEVTWLLPHPPGTTITATVDDRSVSVTLPE